KSMIHILENLREQTDFFYEKIITLLAKRMKLAGKIGKIKKMQGLPFIDKKRWNKVVEFTFSKAESLGLSKTFVKALYALIHKHSINIQKGL
ncbi:MAG: chorismate mutase, partial [Candidatus Daviesbacteria bacterium]|nr:chorismate mutase [Candidatus Daviesbacteria bacterium]